MASGFNNYSVKKLNLILWLLAIIWRLHLLILALK